jgi:hypothetical protein
MIDTAQQEERMALVRRIAIGLAKANDDPILADTKILSRSTFHGNPATEQELDASNPAAVGGEGERFFPHVRRDGRGQLLVRWVNGKEETLKFWIPDAYLNDNTDTRITATPPPPINKELTSSSAATTTRKNKPMLARTRKVTQWCQYSGLAGFLIIVGLFQANKISMANNDINQLLLVFVFVVGIGGLFASNFIDWLNGHK